MGSASLDGAGAPREGMSKPDPPRPPPPSAPPIPPGTRDLVEFSFFLAVGVTAGSLGLLS